jgi:A/G-specific adenine glycosylase
VIDPAGVLAWGVPRLRDLPWRRTRDPWRVLVAEVMLQQTQVERVVPKWEAFLSAYPSPAACARAPLGDVLRLWQGLGYPRRARNLHDAASAMLERHGGRVPDELVALVALPGIGPYTARAVLAFAYERDVAVVDTNIARVLARSAGRRLTAADAQTAADRLVPAGAGWVWNQTLMDLGATLCRPAPRCDACPIGLGCRWHLGANAPPDPAHGSAGVSTGQPRFEGSDRQARGRVLATLTRGPAPRATFEPRIVDGLVADRLVTLDGDSVRLP